MREDVYTELEANQYRQNTIKPIWKIARNTIGYGLFGTPLRKSVFFSVLLLFFVFYTAFIKPPVAFPVGHTIIIEKGETLKGIVEDFESNNIIRSPFFFHSMVIILGGEKSARAGDYYLKEKENIFKLAYRISYGAFGLTPMRVQVPEGLSVEEVALHLSNTIPDFDMVEFLALSKDDEGYLFPDTYYFLPNVSEKEVYRTMKETFESRVEEIAPEVTEFMEAYNVTLKEVVTMASIIELEASDFEVKRTISGVLWNRIKIDMALQVDASFVYLLEKGTSQISLDDLALDSPYNTYKYRGLPPGPITNPGLDSILAAVTPQEHEYFYY
ncbi:MAG: endolytic transglycosylase MltG, partial [Candidatus Paceibacterota bacterium]